MLFTTTSPLDPSLLGWITAGVTLVALTLIAVLIFREAEGGEMIRNLTFVGLLLVGAVYAVGQYVQMQERVGAEAKQQLMVLADVVYGIGLTPIQAGELLSDYNSWDLTHAPTEGMVERRPAKELGLADGTARIQLTWTGSEWVLMDAGKTEPVEFPRQQTDQ